MFPHKHIAYIDHIQLSFRNPPPHAQFPIPGHTILLGLLLLVSMCEREHVVSVFLCLTYFM
jgi:hypothetical protein